MVSRLCVFYSDHMISIRGGSGFGDALYLQSVARYFIERGDTIEVCSKWNDVFRPLGHKCKISPFRRDRIDRLAHYSARRKRTDTDQFQDCCIQAGITELVDLRLDWVINNRSLVDKVMSPCKPIVLLQLPRRSMDRTDNYGIELSPDWLRIQTAINIVRPRATIIQVGYGSPLHRFEGVDIDLVGKTSVADLIDVASIARGFLGYVSYFVPLAESFSSPALFVWSRAGLRSNDEIIRTITPQKILHRKDKCHAVIDDCSDLELNEAVNAFCEQIGSPVAV